MTTTPTSANDIANQLRAGTLLDVVFASGATGVVSFDPTWDEDDEIVVVEYSSGFAAGVTEPICELGDAYLTNDFLADAQITARTPDDKPAHDINA